MASRYRWRQQLLGSSNAEVVSAMGRAKPLLAKGRINISKSWTEKGFPAVPDQQTCGVQALMDYLKTHNPAA